MFYKLWQRGRRGKIWRVMYNLCQDRFITINTKYGPTNDKTKIENEIRHGKVLSGAEEYQEIRAEGLAIKYWHLMISTVIYG